MIKFILNRENVTTELPSGMAVLDFLRNHQKLTGTKEGCREGDCGACMILLGKWDGKKICYAPVNSCLLPLGEAAGKHIVTIEGLNSDERLNPIQQAIADEGAAQCGYCTPGMVVALTGFFMNTRHINNHDMIAALDGNICRCTGYISVRRAVALLCKKFSCSHAGSREQEKNSGENRINFLIKWEILPDYFLQIPEELKILLLSHSIAGVRERKKSPVIVAGGTDLFVQKPEELYNAELKFLSSRDDLKGIETKDNHCYIGAATTVEELKTSAIMQSFFPKINNYFQQISSTPIRNRATVGGNIVNASPIGDITIFLLALNAKILLNDGKKSRELALKDFFKGYKKLDKADNEIVEKIFFPIPLKENLFNFEKVSRRTHLDIAGVNSAIQIQMENDIIKEVHLSAGGVGLVPLYLSQTGDYLKGKPVTTEHIRKAADIAQSEISPISDVRGSKEYKRLLLRQLIFAHFVESFGINPC